MEKKNRKFNIKSIYPAPYWKRPALLVQGYIQHILAAEYNALRSRCGVYWAGVLIVSLVIYFSLSYVIAAWQAPSSNTPPNENEPAFLNIGSGSQLKSGGLEVEGIFTTYNATNLAALGGNVGIGTTTPPEKLTLEGGNFLQTAMQPVYLNSYNAGAGNAIIHIDVSGKYAYGIGNNFFILDVSNPAQPAEVKKITNKNGASIKVAGNYAYIADDANKKLTVVNVSNPSNPTFTELSLTDITPISIFISGKYIYGAYQKLGEVGILVLDISDPSSPKKIIAKPATNVDTAGMPQDFFVAGRYAYLVSARGAAINSKLVIFDISDPLNPVQTSPTPFETYQMFSVYVSGKYAYLGVNDSGYKLKIVDISNPSSVSPVSETPEFGPPAFIDITVAGKYAYANSYNNVRIFDVSDPQNPWLVYTVSSAHSFTETRSFVYNKHLYLAQGQYLDVYDISGIDAPAASIGNISASQISVTENMDIGNNLYVRNGLNVGPGGIKSDGVIQATSTEAFRIKLPLSLPGSCNSSNAGSIYFSQILPALNEPCYCNGSVWTQFDGGEGC